MDETEDQLQNQDKTNINDKTWQDSGGMGGTPTANPKPNKNNLIDKEAIPQLSEENQKMLDIWRNSPKFQKGLQDILNLANQGDENLPTAKELSDRFGGGFKQFIDIFKELITSEITSVLKAGEVPASLAELHAKIGAVFKSLAFSVGGIKDTFPIPSMRRSLELARVDISIIDIDNLADIGDPDSKKEDPCWIIDESKCRGLDEKGIVANPGFGEDWVVLNLYDQKNERNLEIRFKVYMQVPKI
jgi:hypothetical protein